MRECHECVFQVHLFHCVSQMSISAWENEAGEAEMAVLSQAYRE